MYFAEAIMSRLATKTDHRGELKVEESLSQTL